MTAPTSSSAAPRRRADSRRAAFTSSSWPPVMDIALIIRLIPSSAATAAAVTPAGAGRVAATASENKPRDSDQIERDMHYEKVSHRMYQRLVPVPNSHRALPLLTLAALICVPALAQLDLSGVWAPTFHEDNAERGPGPELVDYVGLPINAAARQWALRWNPDRL